MKKVIAILMSCWLALAASAIAQQEEPQQKPKKEKAQSTRSDMENEARPAPKQESAPRQRAETNAREKGPQSGESTYKPHSAMKVPGKEPGHANTSREQIDQRNEDHSTTNESENANNPPGLAPANEREQYNKSAGAPQPNRPNAQGNRLNAQGKKPDPQAIQKIKTEHTNFRAQPRPDKVPAATFNQSYHISGSEHWQGPQYEVFRSYHPEWHDQGWYRSHYSRVELIGGGYNYWNNGYWYPAWGYDPSAQYYAYDAPIYVGSSAEPPDQVIADVQSALQQMGYYQGEVDGLLGPLTREALTAYQNDHGLYATAVIDEPTLSSLGMS